jgi:hypothetical protein
MGSSRIEATMTEQSNGDAPKLHVDSDWKAQARAEKQRLADEAAAGASASDGAATGAGAGAAAAAAGTGRTDQLPQASFKTLASRMVTEAMMALGMIPEPQSGRRIAVLDLARHHIEMLSVLEQKTAGNLDDEEGKLLSTALHELRMQYVQVSQQAIEQQASNPQPPGAGTR